ncbi:MAG: carboxypeptidase-like regulatory domain-containing protein, partial [Bacteroidales bacterium]|nr:carboxypeptidase-like regulatory domain-containing protein [Bacteroidales bacterium]
MQKKINIHAENTTVEDIIIELSKQSGIDFSYSSQIINTQQRISITIKNKTLEETIKKLSKQLNIEFRYVENQIVLKKAKQIKTEKFTLSGLIKDKETGESLIGATVLISGTNTGAISNSYGFYSLTLHRGIEIIEYSYIGYHKQKHKINLDKNIKINLELEFSREILSEVTIETDE